MENGDVVWLKSRTTKNKIRQRASVFTLEKYADVITTSTAVINASNARKRERGETRGGVSVRGSLHISQRTAIMVKHLLPSLNSGRKGCMGPSSLLSLSGG